MPWWFTDRVICQCLRSVSDSVQGDVLDVGCGDMHYKPLFKFRTYTGVDQCPGADVQADIRNLPFDSDRFDTALCIQALEHVDDPHRVLAEVHRVLKKGGRFILTVPFIVRLHSVPHDYWRFSEHGIRYLMNRNGFRDVKILPMGGFLTTQCVLWSFQIWEWRQKLQGSKSGRLLAKVLALMNWIASPLMWWLHQHDKERLTPFNYLAVAEKDCG